MIVGRATHVLLFGIAIEGFRVATGAFGIAIESFRIAVGACGSAIESFRITIESVRIAIETVGIVIETFRIAIRCFRIAIRGLRIAIRQSKVADFLRKTEARGLTLNSERQNSQPLAASSPLPWEKLGEGPDLSG